MPMSQPKMTAKYRGALATMRQAGIGADIFSAERCYQALQDYGYLWDSKTGVWQHLPSVAADPPDPVVRVRIWAEAGIVATMADGVVEAYRAAGLTLLERSGPYPCRPPKQLESRIYLSFMPRGRS